MTARKNEERFVTTLNRQKIEDSLLINYLESQKEKGVPYAQTFKLALKEKMQREDNQVKIPSNQEVTKQTTNNVVLPEEEKILFNGFQAPSSSNFLQNND